ncbi:virulence factor [Candidatus Clavichlamydia salmonicola]|uniref:virulence factor n=1 Tax=Candidatus Clavichlamydia salmonicola TaxID=469812 RepID=UPI001891339E|nr:virulence factor [Candidatus Clavichlamydia salmonicola]
MKATDKKSNLLIKSSLHLESQKFGKKPINKKEPIPIGKNVNSRIEVIGLDFLPSHYHALNAIQNLLAATNYAGNTEGVYLSKENNSFKFEGKIPRIIFTKSEYLEAYGVKRYLTARKKNEFGGNESKEALDALHYLGTQTHLIVSTRKRWKNGEELVDRYQTLSPILRICEGWEGLTSIENNNLDEGKEIEAINIKHKGFVVEPCPLLVDQIDSYFVLKPANTYQEIKLKYPNTSKFAYTFIDWIVKEATLKRMCKYNKEKRWPEKLSIGREALAYALRMDSYIRSRNWKKIEVAMNRCVEIAISLGWLVEHRSIQGKTISKKEEFILNKNKFHQICKEKNII